MIDRLVTPSLEPVRRDPDGPAARLVTAGLDLRLVTLALGCWLAALTGLHLSARGGVTVAAVAGVAAAVVPWMTAHLDRSKLPQRGWDGHGWPARWFRSPEKRQGARRDGGRRMGWIGATVMLGVVLGAAATAARVATRDAEPLASLADRRATVRVAMTTRDDPRPVGRSTGPATFAVSARLIWLEPGPGARVDLAADVLVLARHSSWRGLLPGQRVVASGRLSSPDGGDLRAAVLSTGTAPDEVGPAPWIQRTAGGLRAGLRRACEALPPEPGGLLPGLVIGDTSALDPALAEDFRATGMTHLVAVSGANCAIMLGAVLLLARWCRAGPRWSAVLCAMALAGFVVLARPSPSVLRAAAMGAVALVALATGRRRGAVPALACAVTVLVIVDPELAGDAGFALSVLATGGLLFLAPGWSAALRRRGVPAGLAEAVAVPAAAQVACAPLIASLSATVSLAAVPANLLAVPAVAPATVLGIVAALLSPLSDSAAQFLAWLAGWPARWLVWLAHTGAGAPAGLLPWPGGTGGGLMLAAVLLGLLGIARVPSLRRVLLVVTVAAAVGAMPVRLVAAGWPPAGWFVVACDVGEGDALVLPAGPGQAVVVDAGPQPGPVDRCLRGLGITRVALLVLSHFHADHVGGLAGVVRGRPVAGVVLTDYPEPTAGRAAARDAARRAGASVQVARAGWAYRVGDVRLVALAPSQALHGTRSDPNNNSLVLRATVGGRVVLLAGDAEGEEQSGILAETSSTGLRADVLKIAHHGSSYQDRDFLAAVVPAVVLVSVGRDNDYGHPHVGTLARLASAGARVLRTDRDGDLAVAIDRNGLVVVTHRPVTANRRAARPP